MRLVATEYLTFDGVFEEPGRWSGPFFNEEAQKFKFDELQASDALLLGRKTYEGFAAAWPKMPGTGEFGVKMNSMPKYVVSSTLKAVDWTGSRLVTGEVAGEIRKLKAAPGKDLLLAGSGQLFNSLMQADLIDLYRFGGPRDGPAPLSRAGRQASAGSDRDEAIQLGHRHPRIPGQVGMKSS
jgi:dihydrofolate reductase